jgi:ribosomal protein S18 acetylase RimI-like enzyme
VAAEGWVLDADHAAGAEVAVLVADVDRLAAPGDPGVALSPRPTDAWWALALGRDPTPDERCVLAPDAPPPTAFGLVRDAGVVRAAVVDDHLHLSRLAVVPDARRTGVGTRRTAAAAAWGRARGARWAVLQVALHNTAARALYERLGASEHHRYRYLVPPPGR